MATAALVPIEEYLSRSWEPDREYVDGRLVETNVGEIKHGHLQYLMAKLMDRRGLLPLTAVRVQVKPTRYRIPDVLAVRGQTPEGRFLHQPPYIVVEILSRDDRASELEDKIDDYLDFGGENIWVVDPRHQRVRVETRDGSRIFHGSVETSDGQISIPLSEIFADMPSTEVE